MDNNIKSLTDEFSELESIDYDCDYDIEELYNTQVESARQLLNNTTINGLDTCSINEIISTEPTESMNFNHVSIKMNTDNIVYIGGTLAKDFRLFDFISEVLPGDNEWQFSILENIILPKSIKVLSDGVFYNYHFLKNIIFEDNSELEYLGSGAFAYCSRLLKLDLSACTKLKTLNNQTFACSGITTVKLPDKLKVVGEKAFDDSEIKTVIAGETKYSISEFIDALKNNNYYNFWDFETMLSCSQGFDI